MAVTNPNEIQLNSIRYPLLGRLTRVLTSVFPEKMVIGDYSKDTEPIASTWIMNDHRGGILLEEMDEGKPEEKYWAYWSTCNLGFKGHITLPPLATEVTGWWDWARPTAGTGTNWSDIAQAYDDDDTTDASHTTDAGAWSDYLELTFSAVNTNAIRFILDVNETLIDVQIDVYYDSDYHEVVDWVAADFTDETWYVVGIPAGTKSCTKIQVRVKNNHSGALVSKVSEVQFTTAASPSAGAIWANFNSELLAARGTKLYRLYKTDGDWFYLVTTCAATITDLISSLNSCMYIFCGDDTNYYYLATGLFDATQTDVADAQYGVVWDDKLFKINTAGATSHAAIPNDATAVANWTANGTLDMQGETIQSLERYRDASGNYIIYAGTTVGLWAHDYANAKWLHTELSLPTHPTCGKGLCHWRGGLFVSAGLDVHKYVAAQTATIASMGLDQDDGLPTLRGGEITHLAKGYNEMLALVDSVYEGATSRSTVMAYDDKGWQCWWEAGTNNWHTYKGGISSACAYRYWFAVSDKVYYIPVQRNLRNPKKVTGFTYASAGVHITPWFDADWANGTKLALKFKVKTSGCSADEDVVVDYRIDHAETDLTTGWTNLGTIEADGVTTYTPASAGVEFKSIQFRFTLATGTSTLSPDIEWYSLSYLKNMPPAWGYKFTIDCTDDYDGRSARQLIDAIVTATETGTLITLVYMDTTYYGRIHTVEGIRQTGEEKEGQYMIFFVIP